MRGCRPCSGNPNVPGSTVRLSESSGHRPIPITATSNTPITAAICVQRETCGFVSRARTHTTALAVGGIARCPPIPIPDGGRPRGTAATPKPCRSPMREACGPSRPAASIPRARRARLCLPIMPTERTRSILWYAGNEVGHWLQIRQPAISSHAGRGVPRHGQRCSAGGLFDSHEHR
jgi:hypothetical protein